MDTSIGKAHEKIMSVAQDSEMLRLYQMREMALMDYTSGINNATRKGIAIGEQKGIAIGEQRGMQKERRNFVLNLSKKNKSVSEIAELTGLPEEEVNHILNNN
jgi:predicted transposase/invertase (TIGR01784 family)